LHFIIVAGILHFAFHGELNTAIVWLNVHMCWVP
jgi:hypothetical protein